MNRVTWTASATDDLAAIRDHLLTIDAHVAQAEIDRLVLATYWLLDQPRAGPAIGHRDWRKWKPAGAHHVLLYRPSSQGIEVVHVRHERENWRPER